MGKNDFFKCSRVGKVKRSCSQGYYDKRVKVKVSHTPSSNYFSPSKGSYQPFSNSNHSVLHPRLDRSGYSKGNYKGNPSLFFTDVLSSQKEWEKTTHSRPISLKQTSLCPQIQNGNYRKDRQGLVRNTVGNFSGHHGRLPPRSNCLGIPQVFRICSGREILCVSGTPIRPISSPMGVYKSDKTNKVNTPQTRRDAIFFSGRPSNSSSFTLVGGGAYQDDVRSTTEVRIQNKLGKVIPSSPTTARVSGGLAGSQKSHSFSSSRQNRENFGLLSSRGGKIPHVQERTGKIGGISELRRKLPSIGQDVSHSYHSMDEFTHFSISKGSSNSFGYGIEESLDSLGGSRCLEMPSSYAYSTLRSGDYDRCFSSRLERDSSALRDTRGLGSRIERSVNELEGAQSHSSDNLLLCRSPSGKVCQNSVRQYYSLGLPAPSGFCKISLALGSHQRDIGNVPGTMHFRGSGSYKRYSQCPCGQGFQKHSHINGVVFGSTIFLVDLWAGWSTSGGPFCHTRQYSVAFFCLSVSRLLCGWSGRFQSGLGQLVVSIRLSPSTDSSGGGSETGMLQRFRVFGGPTLACSNVVSPTGEKMSSEFPSPSGAFLISDNCQRPPIPQPSPCLEPLRLDAIANGLAKEGFALDTLRVLLKEHRNSTVMQYQGVWTKFLEFLDTNNINHDSIVLSTVFNFLTFHAVSHHRAYNTIGVYRCALVHPLWYKFKLDIDTKVSVSFMRGLFNMNPPPRYPIMPSWSLSDLLDYLKRGPFEPLEEVSFQFLAKKTLALILLASGRRISEIANISRSYVFRNNVVILKWLPEFRAKRDSSDFRPDEPSISILSSSDESESLLCPVRAWRIYLLRRPRVVNRFNDNCFWPWGKIEMTYVFKSLVADARNFAGIPDEVPIGPHQMRKFAASYSRTYLHSTDEGLFKKMGCKSMSVLKKCYISNVPPVRFSCVVPLGTLLANP